MTANYLKMDSLARRPRAAALLAAFGAVLLMAPGAYAGLGQRVASVAADHEALHGVAQAVTAHPDYDVHEITLADETRVREYVSHAGTVFGVAWSGRSKPDLTVLLGQHYAQYAGAAGAQRVSTHKVFVMSTQDLVMNVVKLPRGFAGTAHVPALLPTGVLARDIR